MYHSFDEYRDRYAGLYGALKDLRQQSSRAHRGHGLDHDVTVAQLADTIAPDEMTAHKTWCAALLHSIDHIVDADMVVEVTRMCAHSLENIFSPDEGEEIVQAALLHGRVDLEEYSLTLQCLQDADMIANLMPAVVIRAGQFQPHLPAFEFEYLSEAPNPRSTYREPKSVLDDFRLMLDQYLPRLRLPRARELAYQYADTLRWYVVAVEKSNKGLGLSGVTL